ncbi:hypothetical protein, partial [Paraburkholderia caribensis]|uniref:hypothetical protein n=1 Tax=Paraburkholderia caribensis TaxID=75105 RepID=UPI0020913BB3
MVFDLIVFSRATGPGWAYQVKTGAAVAAAPRACRPLLDQPIRFFWCRKIGETRPIMATLRQPGRPAKALFARGPLPYLRAD